MNANQGPTEKEIRPYLESIKKKPDDDKAHNNLGNTYFAYREYQEAIKHFLEASQIKPEEWIYYSNLGDAYRGLRDWDQAIKYYNQGLQKNKQDDWMNNGLGLVYYSQGDYKTAIEYFNKAREIKPETNYYLNLGDAYRGLGNLQEAMDWYNEAIGANPKSAAAHNALGVAYHSKGEYKKAIDCYKEALAIDPEGFIYNVNIGDAHRALNEWDQAIPYYEKAMAINPADDSVTNSLGVAYYSNGDYVKAIERYKKAESIAQNPVYYANLGDAYSRLQEWDEAIASYEKAVALNPKDEFSVNGLGIAYSKKGKHFKAIEQFEKALSISEKPVYYANIGDTYRTLKKWDAAIQQYELAVEKSRMNGINATEFRTSLGLAYNDRGVELYLKREDDKAIEDYKKAVELYPENDVIHHNLFLAYQTKGLLQEALIHLRDAIERNPADTRYSQELKDLEAMSGAQKVS